MQEAPETVKKNLVQTQMQEAPFADTNDGSGLVLVRKEVRRETPRERNQRVMRSIWRVRHFRPRKSKLSVCTYGKVSNVKVSNVKVSNVKVSNVKVSNVKVSNV